MIDRYGVDSPYKIPEVKKKVAEKNLSLYGDRYPMRNKDVMGRSLQTRKDNGHIYKWTREQVASYEVYRRQVNFLSEKSYEQHRDRINPGNLERGTLTHHLDHIYPVILGFMNGLPAEDLAHWRNLRIIPHVENRSKGPRTDMKLEDFRVLLDYAGPKETNR